MGLCSGHDRWLKDHNVLLHIIVVSASEEEPPVSRIDHCTNMSCRLNDTENFILCFTLKSELSREIRRDSGRERLIFLVIGASPCVE